MNKEEMFTSAYGDISKEIQESILEISDKLISLQGELNSRQIPIRLYAKTNSLLERYPEDNQRYFKSSVGALFNYGMES